jgi:mannitol-specific phosphotransferase system IIBC component
VATLQGADVHKLIVACDAGMGSSVMLAGTLKKQLKNFPVTVAHAPVAEIPADADLILTHAGLAERARAAAGDTPVIAFNVFLGDPAVTKVVKAIKEGGVIDV